jgi:hypothetical protein
MSLAALSPAGVQVGVDLGHVAGDRRVLWVVVVAARTFDEVRFQIDLRVCIGLGGGWCRSEILAALPNHLLHCAVKTR